MAELGFEQGWSILEEQKNITLRSQYFEFLTQTQ